MTSLHDLVHQNPTVKDLRGGKGPDIMGLDLNQVQGLLVSLFITQKEGVAGRMTEV